MRRVLVSLSALGLASALVSAPVPAAGQATITLSLVDASNTSTTVTAIGEDGGAQTLRVKAVASTAPGANVPVSVTVGASGGTATEGASNDYTRSPSSVTVTINSGATEGFSPDVTITPVSDMITENHETIRFTGTATGYTVSSVNLTITDQDRVIRVDFDKTVLDEPSAASQVSEVIRGGSTLGGITSGVFTASTSSTYSVNLNAGVYGVHQGLTYALGGETASGSDVYFEDNSYVDREAAQARINAGDTTGRFTGPLGFVAVTVYRDAIVEPDEYFHITLDTPDVPGFTVQPARVTIKDVDTRVALTVDTDSGEDGNQSTLAEGASGAGVSVSGSFSGTSSVIGSATEITLSAAGAASPSTGEAGTGDLSYSPSSPNTISIPANTVASSGSTTLAGLTITDDTVVEGPETFEVGVSSVWGTSGGATLTITDDDADIALSVDETSVNEDDGATTVTVTARFAGQTSVLTSATDVTVTVGAGASNGATPDTDFMTSGMGVSGNEFTVSIPKEMTEGTKEFTLTPMADNDAEGVEKIAVSGSATVGGSAVAVTLAEIDLRDSTVALSLHQATSDARALSAVSERGGAQTVRVKATAELAVTSDTTVTVQVGAAGGTAVLGASGDYTRGAATVNVTIPNGATESNTADVTITPRDDGVAEGPETIRFSGTLSGFKVTPADLEITETIELVLSASAVGEGDTNAGAVTATARFAGASSTSVTGATDVVLSFAAGANAEAADFSAPAPAVTLTIPAGSTASGASALSGLGITQDMIAEGAEAIAVGGSVTGFVVSGTSLGITDDDLNVTLTADTDVSTPNAPFEKTLSEGAAAAVRVRAAFADGVTNDLTAGLAVSVTAGEASPRSATEGDDFTAPASPVTVTIPTGSGTESSWANLTGLAVPEDTVAEGDETFLVTGTVPGGTVVADTLTIGANDKGLEVSVSPGTVVEQATGQTTVTVTAGFSGASASELAATTVNVAVAAGGGANGATLATSCPDASMDACTDNAAFTISIPAGQTSADGTFSLSVQADGTVESTETLTVTVTEAGDSTNTASATLNVVDSGIEVELLNPADDSALTSLGEDSGASQVKVKVTMPTAVAAETVVGLNITEGSATEDTNNAWTVREDYRISGLTAPTGTPANHELGVVVAANETTGEATFTITVQDDNADEGNETIRVTGAAVNLLPVLGAALSITDNDDPPNVVLALETPDGEPLTDVQEDDSLSTTVQVRATYQGEALSAKRVTIPITVGKAGETGEATAGTDYQTVSGVSVAVDAFESTGTQTFQLVIDTEDDTDAEGPETVTVVGDDSGDDVGTVGEAQLTIIDDDAAITLAFLNAADEPLASLTEGTGATTVKIRASYPPGKMLSSAQTIPITLEAGTASPSDYQTTSVPDPFQVTISAGQNSGTATFTLDLSGARDDNIDEPNETLRVTGSLAGFIVNSGTLEITDNDGPPTGIALTANPNTAPENRGTSPLTVRLTASLAGNRSSLPTQVRVTVDRSGSTATSGSDYRDLRLSSSTITIPAEAPSATGTFRVVILSDTETESTEHIRIAATSNYGRANADFRITNVSPAPNTGGGGGGGAPPPSGGGGGGGGGAPPPAGPPAPPPPPAEPVCQGRFCDEDGSVHQANIEQIAAWEITLGCDADDATKFCPSAQITRRQMAAFLYRAVSRLGTIPDPAGIEISDVPADAWYRTFAEWVVSTGAFAAPDGVFNPGGVVTRADMAVMMIASFPDINAVDEPEGLFNDVTDADPEVVRAVEGMYHTGVTRGCSATPLNYCPDQPVTRAQMASFFVRAVNYTPPADN